VTLHRYTLPVEDTHWKVDGKTEIAFTRDYDTRSDDLLKLYAKGKQGQWDADTRIDWSLPVDPDDPMQVDDAMLPLFGTPLWGRLSARHVAFGRLALRDYYPSLTEAERREREEFVIAGLYLMRDRFDAAEMWERIGLDPKDVPRENKGSSGQVRFRKRLFSRIARRQGAM